MLADETYDETTLVTTQIGRSLGTDYFGLRDELTETELCRAFEELAAVLLNEAAYVDAVRAEKLAEPIRELVRTARRPAPGGP